MNIIKTLKSSISEKSNYCYSLPVETTKEIIKDVKQLQQENKQLKSIIKTLIKEYDLEPTKYVKSLLKGEWQWMSNEILLTICLLLLFGGCFGAILLIIIDMNRKEK